MFLVTLNIFNVDKSAAKYFKALDILISLYFNNFFSSTYKLFDPKKKTHNLRLGAFPNSGGGSTIRAGQYEQYFIFALFQYWENAKLKRNAKGKVGQYSAISHQTIELASQEAVKFSSTLEHMISRFFCFPVPDIQLNYKQKISNELFICCRLQNSGWNVHNAAAIFTNNIEQTRRERNVKEKRQSVEKWQSVVWERKRNKYERNVMGERDAFISIISIIVNTFQFSSHSFH